MYTCRWFILCENVVQNSQTNNLTMVNALSILRTPSFPALHVRFAFAAILDREGEPDGPLSLRFIRENETGGQVLFTAKGDGQAPPLVQFYLNFPMGIRLLEEGTVTFKIEALEGEGEWYAVGSQSVQVSVVEQPDSSTPPEAEQIEPSPPSD